jgi:uncharacterized protein YjbI with pentapeptide repeats/WD40 repeat protein
MSGSAYTMRGALWVALGAAVLGTGIALLIIHDAPRWIRTTVIVFVVLGLLTLSISAWLRDPDARLRRFVLRSGVLVGMASIAKATMGFSFATSGSLQLGAQLGSAWSLMLGPPWWVDVGCLIGGYALIALAMHSVSRREPDVAPAESRADPVVEASPDEAPAEPASPPEVFRERVRLLFEKRAFVRFDLPDYSLEHGCLAGTCHDASGTRRAVVRCDDRGIDVSADDLAAVVAFAQQLPGGADARIYYATPGARRVDAAIAAPFPTVECVSESRLLDTVVHFEGYLRRLIERYEHEELPYSTSAEKHSLAQTFVPPHYTLHGVVGEPPRAQLRDYLDDWLGDGRPRQIALLADYGMGKSSFLKHYAAYLARRRLDGDSRARIPILLSLTGRSPRNHPGVEGLVQAFIDRYQLRCEVGAFELLMRAGRLVFLIDAFDEMDLVGDRAMRLAHFAELWRLHTAGNKLLFAGRPTFFPDDDELREALHIAAYSPAAITRGYCERVSLAPLRDPDIEASFLAYFPPEDGKRHFGWVKANPRLLELARRPAMMHIIRDTIEELRKGSGESSALREAGLLKQYTEHWIVRQIEGGEPVRGVESRDRAPRRHLLVSPDLRARFSENLAAWMFVNERTSVKSAELSTLFSQWFPEETARVASGAVGQRVERSRLVEGIQTERSQLIEGIQTDLRNCTFLVGDPDGNYVFAHKPFFEYFVAASIDRAFKDGHPLPDDVQIRRWPVEIALHVADLWLLRRGAAQVPDQVIRRVFRTITRPSWRTSFKLLVPWRRSSQQLGVSPPAPMHTPPKPRGVWGLLRWLADRVRMPSPLDVAGRYFDIVGAQRWNALQVLLRTGVPFTWIQHHLFSKLLGRLGSIEHSAHCLETLELSRACFDTAQLTGLDLSERSLAGASFVRARISECTFAGSDLEDADLRTAKIVDTLFDGAKLWRTRFDDASMHFSRFDRADAHGAVFDRARISGSMRLASVRRASFQDVTWDGGVSMRGLDGTNAIALRVDKIPEHLREGALLPEDAPPPIRPAPMTLGPISSLSWGPDDATLLVVSRGSAWLLSARNGSLIQRIGDPSAPIASAAFDESGRVLTIGETDRFSVPSGGSYLRSGTEVLDDTGTWRAVLHRASDSNSVVVRRCDRAHEAPTWSAALPGKGYVCDLLIAEDGAFVIASIDRPGELLYDVCIVYRDRTSGVITGDRSGRPRMYLRRERLAVVRKNATDVYVLASSSAAGDAPAPSGSHRVAVKPRVSLPIASDAAEFSPDGSLLITAGSDGLVSWSCETGRRVSNATPCPSRVRHIARARWRTELALCTSSTLTVIDTARAAKAYVELPLQSQLDSRWALAIADARFLDERTLVTSGLGAVRAWDLQELRESSWFPVQAPAARILDAKHVVDDVGRIHGAPDRAPKTLHPRTKKLIAIGPQRIALEFEAFESDHVYEPAGIQVHDTERGELLEPLDVETKLAAFRPDGGALAFDDNGQLVVRRLELVIDELGRELLRVTAPGLTALGFLSDGMTVLAGDKTGTLHMFELDGSGLSRTLPIAAAPITAIAAAADGRVFVATGDGAISTCRADSDVVEKFAELPAATAVLALSPDDQLLATVSHDDLVRIWRTGERELVATLYHLEAGWAVVRADGKYRYAGDVSRIATADGLRTYRFEDLDALCPDRRLDRPRAVT